MDLSLLRTFLGVYRAGSLSRAAPHLGLSQPAVTAQIRALESALGQQLFQRLPRGVAPTSVADELAREVAPHVDALAAVADRGVAPANPLAKPVHLAGPAELTTVHALPALAELVGRGLKLRVTLGLADDLLAGLAARRFVPRYLCRDELDSGTLVALRRPEVPPINTLFLAARAGTTTLPHIAAVRTRLLSAAASW
ncbi:LysR family transcriptional regulator [Gandjariella thermophila]|uniref:HTH lysR-type domain-containing protein n=1 Tax=Gandjariella thermophila TaxID=1931992 RepID=A0A4D4JAX6_9PSEU|nr:LysR family transcriptional regulator [Gandjariella thermophila]GDY31808.1 hypothetical protein GTS_34410 [Gandjariella thermophila]